MIPPMGMSIREAIKTDVKEMERDLAVISTTCGSRATINCMALMKPAEISSNPFHPSLQAVAQEALVGTAHSAEEHPIRVQLPLAEKNSAFPYLSIP